MTGQTSGSPSVVAPGSPSPILMSLLGTSPVSGISSPARTPLPSSKWVSRGREPLGGARIPISGSPVVTPSPDLYEPMGTDILSPAPPGTLGAPDTAEEEGGATQAAATRKTGSLGT